MFDKVYSKNDYGSPFSHEFIDRVFRLVEYISLTSLLYYASIKLQSTLVSAIYWLCYLLLYSETMNISAHFFNHNKELKKIFPKRRKLAVFISYIIGIGLMTLLQLSITKLVNEKILLTSN